MNKGLTNKWTSIHISIYEKAWDKVYGRVWVAASERVGIRQWGKIYDRVIGRVSNSAWVRIHTKIGLNNE